MRLRAHEHVHQLTTVIVATSFSPSVKAGDCAESGAVSAPLFQELIRRLRNRRRCVLLDLGPAHSRTVALFSQFRCRLEILDIGPQLQALNQESDPYCLQRRIDGLLPACRGESIDMVLCWDFLNYLNGPSITSLMEGIALRAQPGALVHALVVYATKRMPASPGGSAQLDSRWQLQVNSLGEERDAPRYTPGDLACYMPDYVVERGRLLRNGMQEFLFRVRQGQRETLDPTLLVL